MMSSQYWRDLDKETTLFFTIPKKETMLLRADHIPFVPVAPEIRHFNLFAANPELSSESSEPESDLDEEIKRERERQQQKKREEEKQLKREGETFEQYLTRHIGLINSSLRAVS